MHVWPLVCFPASSTSTYFPSFFVTQLGSMAATMATKSQMMEAAALEGGTITEFGLRPTDCRTLTIYVLSCEHYKGHFVSQQSILPLPSKSKTTRLLVISCTNSATAGDEDFLAAKTMSSKILVWIGHITVVSQLTMVECRNVFNTCSNSAGGTDTERRRNSKDKTYGHIFLRHLVFEMYMLFPAMKPR
jgi:hypothetical protein